MQLIKYVLAGIAIILLVITGFSLMVLQIEEMNVSYLKTANQPNLQTNSYLITNAHIVTMTTDTVLRNWDVLVEDGIIKQMGPKLQADDKVVIDANGRYLLPGLIDMHMHLWDKFELGLYLANGVTTVRSLLGMPFHLEVKEDIRKEELIGPLFYTASPQFSGAEDGDIMKKPIESATAARALVKQYEAEGYDYIKTYNLIAPEVFDAVLEQSEETGIPVVAHPSFKVDYDYHFNPLITTVEHTEDIFQQPLNYKIDRENLSSVVKGYAESGQTHCPTLTVFYNLTEIYKKGEAVLNAENVAYSNSFINSAAGDYERHMSIREQDTSATERISDQHKFHVEIVGRLHKAGANIVCGTDAGVVYTAPGFSIHQELAFYREAGMSNYEALKTATVNPTKVYDEYKKFGTIEVGRMANFVLAKENPLEDLGTLKEPEWVMVKGRLINDSLIKDFKEKALNRSNYLATMIRVLKYVAWDK